MVLLGNPLVADSGDVSLIDTSNFGNRCVLFRDEDLGLLYWDGSDWLTASGEYIITRTNVDLIDDFGNYYLELDVIAVLFCSVNGVELDGTLYENFTPFRYYGFANNDTANIKLIIKK